MPRREGRYGGVLMVAGEKLFRRVLRLLPLILILALMGMIALPAVSPEALATVRRHAKAHEKTSSKSQAHSHSSKAVHHSVRRRSNRRVSSHRRSRRVARRRSVRNRRVEQAFVASKHLRPMAQQLARMRTPAAYAGVEAYARAHTGEAAAAAYLALGHAHLMDSQFAQAAENFTAARAQGSVLSDYARYLGAEAELGESKPQQAQKLLEGFAASFPASIFLSHLPLLQAKVYLAENNPQSAIRVLSGQGAITGSQDGLMALAKANQMAGNNAAAAGLYRKLFLAYPLGSDADEASKQMTALGAAPLSWDEQRRVADRLFGAGRFEDAAKRYDGLVFSAPSDETRNAMLVSAAASRMHLNRLTEAQAEALPDSNTESGARRLYLLMELARDRKDLAAQSAIVDQMRQRFPTNRWLAAALYSSANMYLLLNDYPHAIAYYEELASRFPGSRYAAKCHWRAAWLNYQSGNFTEAARLMDEQIALYPGSSEVAGAIYWRGRIYEDQEHRPDLAAACYRTVATTFAHYYYADAARQRLQSLKGVDPVTLSSLGRIHRDPLPELTDEVPEKDEHVVKAELLANAGLNEYIPREIRSAPGSSEWGAFAEANIYASAGDAYRALVILKREIPFYPSAPLATIPMSYWRILYPLPYWSTIERSAAKYGLDPYMVASLIRQESAFNPAAVSSAHALGLMQLLPSVGRTMARQVGLRHFQASDLLKPEINIELGTRYLSQLVAQFGDHPEYAFAAYNAGTNRVTAWQSSLNSAPIKVFVESIPFTETRDYVQAIVRNEAMYRLLEKAQPAEPAVADAAGGAAASAPASVVR